MPNVDFPQWVMDLLSENGEPRRLSRDDFEKLDSSLPEWLSRPRTLRQMADVQLSERYNSLKRQLKTLLNYNQMLHAAPAPETLGQAKLSIEVPAPPDEIPPASSMVQPDADGSGISPVFTGPWKHVYVFLWQRDFDLSQSQDDYKSAFETYRSEFGKKTSGSGKRKKRTYRMPSHSDAKSIRQGYHRQLKRLSTRK